MQSDAKVMSTESINKEFAGENMKREETAERVREKKKKYAELETCTNEVCEKLRE